MSPASKIKPGTYFELLAQSLNLYYRAFLRTFIFAMLVSIIIFIPRLIGDVVGKNLFLTSINLHNYLLLFSAIYFSVLWFLAAILWCIHCVEKNKHESFVSDLEMAGKRIIFVLGAAILLLVVGVLIWVFTYLVHLLFLYFNLYSYNKDVSTSLIFLVLLAQVVISAYLSTLFYFYFPLIVLENDGILLALKQSARLVWKKVGSTLCLQLTPWLIYLLTLIIVKNIFKVNIHIYFMPIKPALDFYPTILHMIILSLFIPWSSSLMLVQLHDLELRKKSTLKK